LVLALAADPRVDRVQYDMVCTASSRVCIANTNGLEAEAFERISYCMVEPVLMENGEIHDSFAYRINADTTDVEGCAREAVADAAADNLTATGVRADKITVILNGVEPLTRSSAEECAALRQSLGIGERDFVCGISARMEPYKGHADLLAAAKTVLEKRPDIKFLLMGTGSAEADVRRQAAEMGLEKSVIFTGFCSDVVPYYSIMDLSLNCSYGTEATSLALLEAMSLGLPTAATRFGGNPGVVADGENGILTPVRDPAAMAEVILRIASDKALYDRLSLGAKRIFAEKFTAAAMTRQIEKVYYEEAARCGFDT